MMGERNREARKDERGETQLRKGNGVKRKRMPAQASDGQKKKRKKSGQMTAIEMQEA
jgi:hypothetical protein